MSQVKKRGSTCDSVWPGLSFRALPMTYAHVGRDQEGCPIELAPDFVHWNLVGCIGHV